MSKAKKTRPVASVDREMRWVRAALAAEAKAKATMDAAQNAVHAATRVHTAAQRHSEACRQALHARVEGKRLVVVCGSKVADWTPAYDNNGPGYLDVRS